MPTQKIVQRLPMVFLYLLIPTGAALAESFASVEPIASTTVLDVEPLLDQDLDVREAFAERLLQCGIVDEVEDLLSDEGVTTTIRRRNTHVAVAAGGFAGTTNPTYAFTFIDDGPNAVSHADIRVLSDSLGYAMSQDSVFLLDGDDVSAFDFPANYVVLEFRRVPTLERSAALFETVGRIDPELFETDTSGYTQFGRRYLSLQSDVPDAQFIAGYVQAARAFGVKYTPIVDDVASLFQGSAAFPGNDWAAHPRGEDYLERIPAHVHAALRRIRQFHLAFTRQVLRKIEADRGDIHTPLHFVKHIDCN